MVQAPDWNPNLPWYVSAGSQRTEVDADGEGLTEEATHTLDGERKGWGRGKKEKERRMRCGTGRQTQGLAWTSELSPGKRMHRLLQGGAAKATCRGGRVSSFK